MHSIHDALRVVMEYRAPTLGAETPPMKVLHTGTNTNPSLQMECTPTIRCRRTTHNALPEVVVQRRENAMRALEIVNVRHC